MADVRDDQLPRGAGDADAVPAVPAASVIALRGDPFEILLLRRTSTSSFVPDAWVFPGGAVDPVDRDLASTHLRGTELDEMRVCASRELFEESGIWVGGRLENRQAKREQLLDDPDAILDLFDGALHHLDRLIWTSRWITPVGVPKRFDTYFFLLEVDPEQGATPENREGVEVRWLTPTRALELHAKGELSMVFPTIKNLEAISGFSSAAELIESRRNLEIPPIQPVLVVEGGRKRIVLPEGE